MKKLPRDDNKKYEKDREKRLIIAELTQSEDRRVIEALHRFINLRKSNELESGFPGSKSDIILAIHALVKLGDVSIARKAALSWYSRDTLSGIMLNHRGVSAGTVPKDLLLEQFQMETDSVKFYGNVLNLLGESLSTDNELLQTLVDQINPTPFSKSWPTHREELEAKIRIGYLVKYANRKKVISLIKREVAYWEGHLSKLKTSVKDNNISKEMKELYDMWYYPEESSTTREWARKKWNGLKKLVDMNESYIKEAEKRIARLLKVLKKVE